MRLPVVKSLLNNQVCVLYVCACDRRPPDVVRPLRSHITTTLAGLQDVYRHWHLSPSTIWSFSRLWKGAQCLESNIKHQCVLVQGAEGLQWSRCHRNPSARAASIDEKTAAEQEPSSPLLLHAWASQAWCAPVEMAKFQLFDIHRYWPCSVPGKTVLRVWNKKFQKI